MTSDRAEVLIVGAGPTGLLLAGDLAEAGVPVTVLERRDGESNLSRAFTVHARTLEELDARGPADGARSAVRASRGLPFPGRCVLRSVMLADVRLSRDPPDILTIGAAGAGFALLAPFGDGWYRAIAWNPQHEVPDTEPVDLAEIR